MVASINSAPGRNMFTGDRMKAQILCFGGSQVVWARLGGDIHLRIQCISVGFPSARASYWPGRPLSWVNGVVGASAAILRWADCS